MSLSLAKIESFSDNQLLNFFEKYPYRQFYRNAYKISNKTFALFHLTRLKQLITSDNFTCFWVHNQNEILSIIGILKKSKESEILNFNCMDISLFYNHISPTLTLNFIKQRLNDFIFDAQIKHVTVHPDASDLNSISFFQKEMNFKFIGSSIRIKTDYVIRNEISINNQYFISNNFKNYIGDIIELSKTHSENQFFNDLSIPSKSAKIIFNDWLRTYITNVNTKSLVLIEKTLNKAIGIVCWTEPKLFNKITDTKILTLDFIVIDNDYKGKGLAKLLINSMMNIVDFKTFETRLMTSNMASLALFQSFKSKVVSNDIWLSNKI